MAKHRRSSTRNTEYTAISEVVRDVQKSQPVSPLSPCDGYTLSSRQAECMPADHMAFHLRHLLRTIGFDENDPAIIYEGNLSE